MINKTSLPKRREQSKVREIYLLQEKCKECSGTPVLRFPRHLSASAGLASCNSLHRGALCGGWRGKAPQEGYVGGQTPPVCWLQDDCLDAGPGMFAMLRGEENGCVFRYSWFT